MCSIVAAFVLAFVGQGRPMDVEDSRPEEQPYKSELRDLPRTPEGGESKVQDLETPEAGVSGLQESPHTPEAFEPEVHEWIAAALAWNAAAKELREGTELWTVPWPASLMARPAEARRAASSPEWTTEVAEAAKRTGAIAKATAEGALAVSMEDVGWAWWRTTEAWEAASQLIAHSAVGGWTAAAATATATAARATAEGAQVAESPRVAKAWADAAAAFDTAATELMEAEAASAVSSITLARGKGSEMEWQGAQSLFAQTLVA